MGVNGVNIVNFMFGCVDVGGEVIVLFYVDEVVLVEVCVVFVEIDFFI